MAMQASSESSGIIQDQSFPRIDLDKIKQQSREYESTHGLESSNFPLDQSKVSLETLPLDAIDITVKKYADIILHAIEGFSSRLSFLESRTQNIEHGLDELKISMGRILETNSKLQLLDYALPEVKTRSQVRVHEQEIYETRDQGAKSHYSGDNSQISEKLPSTPPTRQQSPAQFSWSPQLPAQPSSTAHLPPQPVAPSGPYAPTTTQTQKPYFHSPDQAPENPSHQDYSLPPQQHHMPPQHYSPPPQQTHQPTDSATVMPNQHYPPPPQQTHKRTDFSPTMPSQHYSPPSQQNHQSADLASAVPNQHYPPPPQQTHKTTDFSPTMPSQHYSPPSQKTYQPANFTSAMPTQHYSPLQQTQQPADMAPSMTIKHYPLPPQQTLGQQELPSPMPVKYYPIPAQQTHIQPEPSLSSPTKYYPLPGQQTHMPPNLPSNTSLPQYPSGSYQSKQPTFQAAVGMPPVTQPITLPTQMSMRPGLPNHAYGPGLLHSSGPPGSMRGQQ